MLQKAMQTRKALALSRLPLPTLTMEAAWTKSPGDVLAHFQVDAKLGLSAAHAAKNRELYGKNGE